MPTYEYKCFSCDHRLEVVQKITEDALVDCPNCGKPELKRLLSSTAFQLKGSGWYATDYGSSSSSSAGSTSDSTTSADNKSKDDSSSASEKSSGEKSAAENKPSTESKSSSSESTKSSE